MSQTFLPTEWQRQLSDPYAVLGISVAADDSRIIKRYRAIAKQLHPDRYVASNNTDKELATAVFTRLINPAYENLKQQQSRSDTIAMLRLRARRLELKGEKAPQSSLSCQLIQIPVQEAEVFYEQAIAKLAENQYKSLAEFEQVTKQLNELNLIYLHLKTDNLFIREKRTGIIPAVETKPIQTTEVKEPPPNYAQSHYQRATQYGKQGNWTPAVLELRDAIKLEPDNSNYHALLGFVYFKQNLTGMATVHIRQALKLNPEQPLALKCASLLKIDPTAPVTPKAMAKASGIAGLLSLFLTGKRSVSQVLKSR
jgi:curved DNA-binding protein CbpA